MEANFVFFKENIETLFLNSWHSAPFSEFTRKPSHNAPIFSCVEHYMAYQKALYFKNMELAQEILSTTHPKEIKALVRKIQHDHLQWDNVKVDFFRTANILKFSQNISLKTKLLHGFGDNPLFVNADPYDSVWGIGYCADSAMKYRHRWGNNLAGKIITDVRNELLSDDGIKQRYQRIIDKPISPRKRASFYPTSQFLE